MNTHNSLTVSAPGKLMLFGEHAVVYGYPCIVTAMNQRITVTVEVIDTPEFFLEAPDVHITNYKKSLSDIGKGEIPKGAQFVEMSVKNMLESQITNHESRVIGYRISTFSEFSSKVGFGSSSASTVCVVKAISELLHVQLTYKEIFDIAYKTVMDIQKKGSGFDIAAAAYGGTLYFVTGGKLIEPMTISKVPLVVGYSGIKADTVTLINQVKKAFEGKEEKLKQIYTSIGDLVEKAKTVLLNQDWKRAGELMSKNQFYLQQLGVSIPKLDAMIQAANTAGAYGAKLSGAGGGDCMIALVPEDKRKAVENAIVEAGGKVINVKPNAEGVSVSL